MEPIPKEPRELTFQIGEKHEERYVRLLIDQCCGCGDCEDLCPVDAIRLDATLLPCIEGSECIGCGICYQWCPERALVMPGGWHRCD